MAYTLGDLRDRVINDKLDDDSFDGPTVDRFINDAQRDIWLTFELPFMETTFAGALPQGERIFLFPDDYQSLQSIKITDPEGSQKDISELYATFRDFNKLYPTPANNSVGPINMWTLHGGKMYSQAPLDQPYTLEIFYIKTPTPLEDDDDVPEVPSEFEELLVLGAFIRVLQRNEDYDLAGANENKYNDLLDKMVDRLGLRQTAKYPTMRLPNHRAGRRGR